MDSLIFMGLEMLRWALSENFHFHGETLAGTEVEMFSIDIELGVE